MRSLLFPTLSRGVTKNLEPFDEPPLASIMEEEEAPSEPVCTRVVRTDAPERAKGSERNVRLRRDSRVEPEAERPRSRRVSSYDITDDLPQQICDQLSEARTAQSGDLSGTKSQRRTTYKEFIANRVLTKEQVQHQPREEYKRLPGTLNYHTASPFIQRTIEESRAKEWQKYQDFQAAIPNKGQDLLDLHTEGPVALPVKWVDTIKNSQQRKHLRNGRCKLPDG